MALAVLLVIGAGLLVRTYVNLSSTDPGFNPDRVLTFFLHVSGRVEFRMEVDAQGQQRGVGSYAPMSLFFTELEERIAGLPGVVSVADATSLPLDDRQYDRLQPFYILDQVGGAAEVSAQSAVSRTVSPEYLRLLGVPLVAGRGLEARDGPSSPGVTVVDESFASRFFPGQNPLGQRLRFVDNVFVSGQPGFQVSERLVDELEIVGVVGDVKYLTLAEPPEPSFYLSSEQWIQGRRTVVVRTAVDDPESLVSAIRYELDAMDSSLNPEFAAFATIVDASMARERLGTTLLVIFGAMALVLAAVGLSGLMSYSVAQRSGEIAVRRAVGASPRGVLALVMGRGVTLALCGVALGVVAAIALRQVIAAQLYGIAALDPLVFLVASLVLFGVAVLACYLPAQRATKIDPVDLLRAE
jgi:putative ABC transport system permease protein